MTQIYKVHHTHKLIDSGRCLRSHDVGPLAYTNSIFTHDSPAVIRPVGTKATGVATLQAV